MSKINSDYFFTGVYILSSGDYFWVKHSPSPVGCLPYHHPDMIYTRDTVPVVEAVFHIITQTWFTHGTQSQLWRLSSISSPRHDLHTGHSPSCGGCLPYHHPDMIYTRDTVPVVEAVFHIITQTWFTHGTQSQLCRLSSISSSRHDFCTEHVAVCGSV